MVLSSREVIYLDVPLDSENVYRVYKDRHHLKTGDKEVDDLCYDTKFIKYLKVNIDVNYIKC